MFAFFSKKDKLVSCYRAHSRVLTCGWRQQIHCGRSRPGLPAPKKQLAGAPVVSGWNSAAWPRWWRSCCASWEACRRSTRPSSSAPMASSPTCGRRSLSSPPFFWDRIRTWRRLRLVPRCSSPATGFSIISRNAKSSCVTAEPEFPISFSL